MSSRVIAGWDESRHCSLLARRQRVGPDENCIPPGSRPGLAKLTLSGGMLALQGEHAYRTTAARRTRPVGFHLRSVRRISPTTTGRAGRRRSAANAPQPDRCCRLLIPDGHLTEHRDRVERHDADQPRTTLRPPPAVQVRLRRIAKPAMAATAMALQTHSHTYRRFPGGENSTCATGEVTSLMIAPSFQT